MTLLVMAILILAAIGFAISIVQIIIFIHERKMGKKMNILVMTIFIMAAIGFIISMIEAII